VFKNSGATPLLQPSKIPGTTAAPNNKLCTLVESTTSRTPATGCLALLRARFSQQLLLLEAHQNGHVPSRPHSPTGPTAGCRTPRRKPRREVLQHCSAERRFEFPVERRLSKPFFARSAPPAANRGRRPLESNDYPGQLLTICNCITSPSARPAGEDCPPSSSKLHQLGRAATKDVVEEQLFALRLIFH